MSSTAPEKSVIAQVQAKLGIYADGSIQLELQFPKETHDFFDNTLPTPKRFPPPGPARSAAELRSTESPALRNIP